MEALRRLQAPLGPGLGEQVANPPLPGAEMHGELDATNGVFGKMMGRLFGTDVDDPMPWTRMGTTIGGGLTGGYIGATVPGGPVVKGVATAAGSVAGTMLGAMAPETTLSIMEEMGFIEPGERERLGLNGEQLMTVLEGEALLDVATMGGVSLLRLGGRGVSTIMTGANRGTRGMAETASREGIALLPVQVGERQLARGFVSVIGRFPWVAGALKNRAEAAMGQIQRAYEGIPQRLGPLSSYDEIGAHILRDATHTAEAISTGFGRQLDDLFHRAAMNGVTVRPTNTRAVTDSILKRMDAETPKGYVQGTRLAVTESAADLKRFINKTTKMLSETDPATGRSGLEISDQSMLGMNTILHTIDEKMVKYADKGDHTAMQRLERLRQAVQQDMMVNATQNGTSTTTSRAIVADIRRIDDELTGAVNQLFNSTTAQRMGGVVSTTARAARFATLGTRGVDDLARAALKGDNPNVVGELQRLVQPETMRRIASTIVGDAFEKSIGTETGAIRFDIEAVAKTLGLNAPASSKFAQTEALLQASGGMTMRQLTDLVEIGRRANMAEIPDTSAFLARKASFTGMQGILRTVLPYAAVGTAGYAGGPVAGIVTILGAKGIANMISNPASARALRAVLDQESKTAVKYAAAFRAVGTTLGNMVREEVITSDQAHNLSHNFGQFIDAFDKRWKMEQNP